MTSPETWQERIDALAYGEVQPLIFATDVERREDLTVHVVLIDPADDVHTTGHASHGPVFSQAFDLASPATEEQIRLVRRETIARFGVRLRTLLAEPEV